MSEEYAYQTIFQRTRSRSRSATPIQKESPSCSTNEREYTIGRKKESEIEEKLRNLDEIVASKLNKSFNNLTNSRPRSTFRRFRNRLPFRRRNEAMEYRKSERRYESHHSNSKTKTTERTSSEKREKRRQEKIEEERKEIELERKKIEIERNKIKEEMRKVKEEVRKNEKRKKKIEEEMNKNEKENMNRRKGMKPNHFFINDDRHFKQNCVDFKTSKDSNKINKFLAFIEQFSTEFWNLNFHLLKMNNSVRKIDSIEKITKDEQIVYLNPQKKRLQQLYETSIEKIGSDDYQNEYSAEEMDVELLKEIKNDTILILLMEKKKLEKTLKIADENHKKLKSLLETANKWFTKYDEIINGVEEQMNSYDSSRNIITQQIIQDVKPLCERWKQSYEVLKDMKIFKTEGIFSSSNILIVKNLVHYGISLIRSILFATAYCRDLIFKQKGENAPKPRIFDATSPTPK